MPKTSHSARVAAPVETIWQLLLEKIEHPGRFIPSVSEVEMIEREPGYVVRRMKVGSMQVVERITAYEKSHEIDFLLLEHPLYAGQVVNRIEPPLRPGLSATLTIALDWRRKDGRPDALDLGPQIAAAVQATKEEAESRAG